MIESRKKLLRRLRATRPEQIIAGAVSSFAADHGYIVHRMTPRAAEILDRVRTYAAAGGGRCAKTTRVLGQPLEREEGPRYSRDSVQQALKELRDLGLIRAVGTAADRATIYELVEALALGGADA